MSPEDERIHVMNIRGAKVGDCVYAHRGWREKFDQQTARIAALEAQVTALKKIAEGERAYILSINVLESIEVDTHQIDEARRQLAEEHPEAFR